MFQTTMAKDILEQCKDNLVVGYSYESFTKLLFENSTATNWKISQKQLIKLIHEHLEAQGAKSIIVERDYLCRHFLQDYILCYVRTSYDYNRRCVRLHFFSTELTTNHIDILCSQEGSELAKEIQQYYVGFVTVRGLNRAIIGKSVLKYPIINDKNIESTYGAVFPERREYKVHLLGREFSLKSIAFQEQDRTAAACASVALWSVFSITGYLYHHAVPSPGQITKSATKYVTGETRTFPNRGLTMEQVIQAHWQVGLEPLVVKAKFSYPLSIYLVKAYIKAFIDGKVPLTLGFDLIYHDKEGNEIIMDRHAIAITGYRLDEKEYKYYKIPENHQDPFRLESSRIGTIFAHDDQIGPFTPMRFEEHYLSTSWRDPKGNQGNVKAKPFALFVPFPLSCRMPLSEVNAFAEQFDQLLKFFHDCDPILISLPGMLTWDIGLSEGQSFKEDIANSKTLKLSLKHDILFDSVPGFVWRAIGSVKGERIIEIVTDATDFGQRLSIPRIVAYNDEIVKRIFVVLNYVKNQAIFDYEELDLYDWLFREIDRWIKRGLLLA